MTADAQWRCRRAILAVVMASGVLASCGSDDATTQPPGDSTTAPTADPTTASPATVTSDPNMTSGSNMTSDPVVTSEPNGTGGSTTEPIVTGPLPIPSVSVAPFATLERTSGVAVRDGDPRLFVLEQVGRVHALVDGVSDGVVLDLTDRVGSGGSEQGLLGMAFDPDVDRVFVHYTDRDGDTVVAELQVDAATGAIDADTFREVLTVEQPYPNHNGGALAFGPDGLLYIGLGDGGSGGDPERVALDLSSRLGKILRIDPDPSGDDAFTVPPDNPFVDADGADPTVWAYGLRNPWRFSFDEATGDLWIADVGQNEFEEINRSSPVGRGGAGRGASYGWSAFEGNDEFNADQPKDGHVAPVATYAHADGNCSVSGGAVYRGAAIDDLRGWYVYGDYCSGRIWGLDPTSTADPGAEPVIVELGSLPGLAAISPGPDGELVAISNDGTLALLTIS